MQRERDSSDSTTDRKVFTTAVVISPPQADWPPIQNIRSQFDKAFARWPPHINLLYPFVPEQELEEATKRISRSLHDFKPFELTLAQFDMFSQGRSGVTVHLKPNDDEAMPALKRLQSALEAVYPYCDDLSSKSSDGFHPHLTVGQWPTRLEAKKFISQLAFKPLTFQVNCLYILVRTKEDPFRVFSKVLLLPTIDTAVQPPQYAVPTVSIETTTPKLPMAVVHSPPPPVAAYTQFYARFLKWFSTNTSHRQLPKTKLKLAHALKHVCISWETVPVQHVLAYLREQQIVVVNGNKVHVIAQSSSQSHSMISPQSTQEIVEIKAKEWVVHHAASLPTTKEPFERCLAQICKHKRMHDAEKFVEWLLTCNVLTFKDSTSDELLYNVPATS